MVGREKRTDSKTVAVCHLKGMHFSNGMDGLISSVTVAEAAVMPVEGSVSTSLLS